VGEQQDQASSDDDCPNCFLAQERPFAGTTLVAHSGPGTPPAKISDEMHLYIHPDSKSVSRYVSCLYRLQLQRLLGKDEMLASALKISM
jgi:hypothetical protein